METGIVRHTNAQRLVPFKFILKFGCSEKTWSALQICRQHKDTTALLQEVCYCFGPQALALVFFKSGSTILDTFATITATSFPDTSTFFLARILFPLFILSNIVSVTSVLVVADRVCKQAST